MQVALNIQNVGNVGFRCSRACVANVASSRNNAPNTTLCCMLWPSHVSVLMHKFFLNRRARLDNDKSTTIRRGESANDMYRINFHINIKVQMI